LTVLTPPTLVVSRAEYYFSVEKAKRDLGWRPLFTPDEGIDLSVRYYTAAAAPSPSDKKND
jgi:nucleoside-diphosphate-sugar epimerase